MGTLAGPAGVGSRIAEELGVRESQVRAAVELLDAGSTVPFIARYRKEVTGGLDDAQLRTLEERLHYLRELDERRAAIIESIRAQGKLDDELHRSLLLAETKARLEDIYLPYKPKRRTKAQIAREAGHEPVADALLADPTTDPAQYTAEQLDGARAILVERFAEDADLVGELREMMWNRGQLTSTVRPGKEEAGAKFADYFEFSEAFSSLPSHRVLALFRGEKEEVLSLQLEPDTEELAPGERSVYEGRIAAKFGIADRGRPADSWLLDTVRWAWRTKLQVSLGIDTRMRLRQAAEKDAVDVFAANLRDLLLAAPAGTRTTMGLDPGYRTGVKVAVVDATGKVVATEVIYPHKPQGQTEKSLAVLGALVARFGVELIAIGNGTASRETDALVAELISRIGPTSDKKPTKVVVSEAGASVYSASAYASQELPELDVSLRGAVSIARRLQDPLAELVKIDPKSIGVGQYQHDVSETLLARSLGAVVEDAVNAVGVDVNTASVPLLSRVSGIGSAVAESIVAHRDQNGPFRSRTALLDVPRLGPKAFEQCAGFLRIRGGDDPLDTSAVHPEAYPVVRRILEATGRRVDELIGNTGVLRSLRPAEFTDEKFGVPTVTDIIGELEKPGRDPRPEFKTAEFAAGVEKVADLKPGMVLEGVVTNVAAFGAFVDVGVHQDGLVHVSAMSHSFVKDPREVVKSGDVVKVKVLEVDVARQRIGLSLRLDDEPGAAKGERGGQREGGRRGGSGGAGGGQRQNGQGRQQSRNQGRRNAPAPSGSMADALRRAGFGK
ncbi:RNA-binding transcriptional accessory protein [Nocardia farcinica]|uniref:Tex family protein n=1 Tax=Nocardia TaxID=1817 RepID=UPI000BF19019|nr:MULTISPECIES: Tex family protein [Nocardia]MBF6185378.1 RNA-binding transcriptional accessory protein [Nocardia farcinica]MBF6250812.1 RNA-binding transcriptional accessory protein [Nocardia farcinica]MBF6257125.1 RNA-binding transcriptional accessory protein [Nocardia farcinica]MBF6261784.1 RNA-binding transcriptional accessory protein [Nocardia farcinica]MBF6280323.1 RNA-binding transcriptional accessory protein [Nocardia farcinica]